MRCPECAQQTTKVRTAANLQAQPTLTYGLIAANVLVGLGSLVSGGGLSGYGGRSPLLALGALFGPAVHDGQWWRLVTSGFLHAGPLHLVVNMYALYVLGGMLEPAVGRLRFGLIYFVALLAGSFGALLLSPNSVTVGASGAIFGLMGAAFIVMRSRGVNPMDSGLGVFIVLNLGITFLIPGISIGGHLGGLVGGGLAAFLLFELRRRVQVPPAVLPALVVALGLLAAGGSIALAAG
jgi:membrane associated rhomboid family serine protease